MEETQERIYECRKVEIEETLKKGNTEEKEREEKDHHFCLEKP